MVIKIIIIKSRSKEKKSVWQNLPVFCFFGGRGRVGDEIPGDRPFFCFFSFLAKLGLCLGLQTSQSCGMQAYLPCGMWDLSFQIRDWTWIPSALEGGFLQLDHQGSPLKLHFNICVPFEEKLKGISSHRHLLQSLGYDSGKSYSSFKN